jgi:membrane protease YdiL (CAAX protease family)
MINVLAIIAVLRKLLKNDFGFIFGESKVGIKYLIIFTVAYTAIALASHIFMHIFHQLPTYDFPLNKNNIIGILGFQLFLSGSSEEILYRALPITELSYIFRNSLKIRWNITLENIIASLFFFYGTYKLDLITIYHKSRLFSIILCFYIRSYSRCSISEEPKYRISCTNA